MMTMMMHAGAMLPHHHQHFVQHQHASWQTPGASPMMHQQHMQHTLYYPIHHHHHHHHHDQYQNHQQPSAPPAGAPQTPPTLSVTAAARPAASRFGPVPVAAAAPSRAQPVPAAGAVDDDFASRCDQRLLHQDRHQQQRDSARDGGAETLRDARRAQRRNRDDAWNDEQSALGSAFDAAPYGGRGGRGGGGADDEHDGAADEYRTRDEHDTARGKRRVDLGVNLEHHAPFLADTATAAGADGAPITTTAATAIGTHHALVWPARDPEGVLATLATKGSAALRAYRARQVQQRSVRARLTGTEEDHATTTASSGHDGRSVAGSMAPTEPLRSAAADDVAVAAAVVEAEAILHERAGSEDQIAAAEDDGDNGDGTGGPPAARSTPSVTVTASTTSAARQPSTVAVAVASASTARNDDDDQRQERERIAEQRASLPTFKVRDRFIEAVREHHVLVVQGETGSGKTTQLPQYLLEAPGFVEADGSRIIGCTQPRRVAAIGVARRVAHEVGCRVGAQVGYAVRLEDETSDATRLKFMTDGVLLREAVLDPNLWKYGVIVLDEAHERSIDTDVLLGVMKRVLRARKDFRLVIMSATMQIEKFAEFFGDAPIFEVSGRTFPVTPVWAPAPVQDYVEEAVLQVVKFHMTAKADDGDILVFMTGEEDVRCVCDLVSEKVAELEAVLQRDEQLAEEIARETAGAAGKGGSNLARSAAVHHHGDSADNRDTADDAAPAPSSSELPAPPLQNRPRRKRLDVVPCFSTILVNREQLDRVLNPPADPRTTRKCVVATNVAETSLTIDGITCVVDCGFMKCKVFKPKLGAHPLLPFPIAQAQATQRMGRAGRTREGVCYRLYTQDAYEKEMLEAPVPEIKRSSIDRVCLFVKAMGIRNVEGFDFIDPPPTEIVHKSLYSLWLLGALDDRGDLTDKGTRLAKLPVEPAMGVVLLTAAEFRCARECISIAAMLSVDTRALFAVPRDQEEKALAARAAFVDVRSDHVTLLNLLAKFIHELELAGDAAARRWAGSVFVSFSVLKTAQGIREQLVKQLGQALGSGSVQRGGAGVPNATNSSNNSGSVGFNDMKFASTLEAVRFCLVAGFFPQCAQRKRLGEYVTVLTRVPAQLVPTSALANSTAEFVIYNELTITTDRSMLSTVTAAEPAWLERTSRGLFFVRGGGMGASRGLAAAAAVEAAAGDAAPVVPVVNAQSTLEATAAMLRAEMQSFGVPLVGSGYAAAAFAATSHPPQTSHSGDWQATVTGLNPTGADAADAGKPAKFVPRKMRK